MPDGLGRSVYLASFERQRPELERNAGTGAQVFLSLHMGEEFAPDYCRRAEGMCRWLQEAGFRTIADVSVKTVEQFGQPDLVRLARRLGLWALRVDYGLSWDEIAALACELPVVLNASTTPPEQAARIARSSPLAMALHNFYPRPETGADDGFFRERTRAIQQAGLKVLAFVPGDGELRGPVCEGLPTLERHRGLPPSACFADLLIRFGADGAFVGDPGISPREESRIERFCRDGVLELPARLDEAYAHAHFHQAVRQGNSPPGWTRRTPGCMTGCSPAARILLPGSFDLQNPGSTPATGTEWRPTAVSGGSGAASLWITRATAAIPARFS